MGIKWREMIPLDFPVKGDGDGGRLDGEEVQMARWSFSSHKWFGGRAATQKLEIYFLANFVYIQVGRENLFRGNNGRKTE